MNEAAERFEAGLTSDLDFADDELEPRRGRYQRYACSDRMCGATDCQTCYPGNHEEEP